MDVLYKRRLKTWVNENFGNEAGVPYNNTPSGPSATDKMSSNANHTPTNPMPFSNNVQDIANEEKLKNSHQGITSVKELKQLVRDYLTDVTAAAKDAMSDGAAVSAYTKMADLLQKPEIYSAIDHLAQELKLKQQGMEVAGNNV